MQQSFIHEYNENLVLKAELAIKNMVEKKLFNEVVFKCSRLENRSANLELKLQHEKESFLNNRPLNNQNAPKTQEFFHINKWQAKLESKDVSIAKLKKHIENLKGKNVVEQDATPNNAKVIALGMFKLDLEPLSTKVLKNKDAHIDYIKQSQEHADTLQKIVEYARALRPLDSDLDAAWLGHNLFSVGQFCDSDLEVASRQHTCYISDLEGVDLLNGSRGLNLYTLSLEEDMMLSSPICLLSNALKTKSWLWHRSLSRLNFDSITLLAKQGLVRGLPKLKFKKDHLCFACALGKKKKHTHKPKAEDSIQGKLYLLHMDLCWPMRIQSINGQIYILVIVYDYSSFTWVNFLRSKVEVLNALCYPTNDNKDLGKLKPKVDIGIFVGYAPTKKAYRNYNKRTRLIIETIHVDFDELTAIASEIFSSGPGPQLLTPRTISSGLVQNPPSPKTYVPPTKKDWDILFQPMFDEYFNPPLSVVL
ncbi:integrase, catalytic region, zinc finger, CCHC-type containing protein [Tanacetum coccineum]